jgi:hypothetical protein
MRLSVHHAKLRGIFVIIVMASDNFKDNFGNNFMEYFVDNFGNNSIDNFWTIYKGKNILAHCAKLRGIFVIIVMPSDNWKPLSQFILKNERIAPSKGMK